MKEAIRRPLCAAALAALLLAPGPAAADDPGNAGPLRFGKSAAVPCTLHSWTASLAEPVPASDQASGLCPSFSERPAAEWKAAYGGLGLAVGLGYRPLAEASAPSELGGTLSLGSALRYRGLTLGATYFDAALADAALADAALADTTLAAAASGYNIDFAYSHGSLRLGVGYLRAAEAADAREAVQSRVSAVSVDLEYSFTPTFRGFARYLSSVEESRAAARSPGAESAWSIGVLFGF